MATPTAKPQPDVWLAILILTSVAMLVACGLMYMENSSL